MQSYLDAVPMGAKSVPEKVPASAVRAGLNPALLGSFIVGVIAFIGPLRPRPDPDSWWHLATGRLILDTGAIPTTDPFSWTEFGRPWVAHEWLSEAVFAAIDRLFGPIGLLVLSGLAIGTAFLLMRRALSRITHNDWIVAICLAPALYLSTITWSVRPHLFSVLLFTLFLDIILGARLEHRHRLIWWLVPATMLWANLHGAFVSGVLLLWVFALVSAIERRPEAKMLLVVATMSLLAGAATPNGFGIYAHVVHVAQVSTLVIEEWQPPGLSDVHSVVFALMMMAAPLAVALVRRRDWALLASAVVFGLLGLGAVKNVWQAGIVCAAALAWALSRWEHMPVPRPTSPLERRVLGATMAAIAMGALVLSSVALDGSTGSQLRAEGDFPVGAANALNTRPTGRLLNTYTWGGYLIWKTPRFPVAIDGRNDMYSKKTLAETAMMVDLLPGWKNYLDDHAVRYVLWTKEGPLTEALKLLPGWRVVFADDEAILFERSQVKGEPSR